MVGLSNTKIVDYNKLIEYIITLYHEIYPDVNYIQCLFNLGILDEKEYFFGTEIVDRRKETSEETVIRILPNIIKLIEYYDESVFSSTSKMKYINLISLLDKAGMVSKIDKYEI